MTDAAMHVIEMYASMWCGFCHRTKELLREKGVTWTEYDVDAEPERRREMMRRGGARTVPQVFVDGRPLGGCDELYDLERAGRLDAILGLAGDDASGEPPAGDGGP